MNFPNCYRALLLIVTLVAYMYASVYYCGKGCAMAGTQNIIILSPFEYYMNTIINKGRFDPERIWGIILGALVIGIITGLLLDGSFSGKYYRLDNLVMAIAFFMLFGYFLFKSIRNYKAITIYENSLKVRWLFGLITATINKDDLTQFGRTILDKSDHIYIKTNNNDLLLEEKITENNELIIEQLRTWRIKRKDNIPINKFLGLKQKAYGVGMMAFSLLLLTGLFLALNSPPSITDETKFVTISGYLQSTPEIIKPRGRSSTKDVRFYLNQYGGIQFSASYIGYELINHNSLLEFRRGDSITLLITQNDYEKKISGIQEAGYWEKHSHWPTIGVYAVEIENKKLLSLQAYKTRLEDGRGIHPVKFIIIIAVCVGLFIWGIKEFRTK